MQQTGLSLCDLQRGRKEGENSAHRYIAELCSAACLGERSAENNVLRLPVIAVRFCLSIAHFPVGCAEHYLLLIFCIHRRELIHLCSGCNRYELQMTDGTVLSFQGSVALGNGEMRQLCL